LVKYFILLNQSRKNLKCKIEIKLIELNKTNCEIILDENLFG
jgi:hypothetical protein